MTLVLIWLALSVVLAACVCRLLALSGPSPNAQHHETPRIIQSVPPVESASSSEVIVAR
jgi:hypothetical protein